MTSSKGCVFLPNIFFHLRGALVRCPKLDERVRPSYEPSPCLCPAGHLQKPQKTC
jgi:hypothetical protein